MNNNDVPNLADDIINSPKKICVNCGHDILLYHHPLVSVELLFHDNHGVFSCACTCGCKDPKVDKKLNIKKEK